MKYRSPLKLTCSTGQSVVELALILPFLVVLMLGLVDLSRAIQAYNIIANMTREGANLNLRNARAIDPQDIMDSLANTAQPLSMNSKGMMYLTRIQKMSDAIRTEKIPWGNGKNKSVPESRYDENTVPAAIIAGMKNGDMLFVFEVFYKYDSLFKPGDHYGAFSPQLHSIAIF